MQFDIGVVEYIQDVLGWAAPFFRMITELGSELFFIGLVLSGFWAFKKRETIITGFVLITSLIINYWLKVIIANPRPDASYGYQGYSDVNYSTPSGHAQNSTSLFGWIGLKVKKFYAIIIAAVLATLIGISRVVLGVHYLEDVLLGWGIGILIIVSIHFLEPKIANAISQKSDLVLYGGLFVFGLLTTILTTILFPPETIPDNDNFGVYGGLLIGLAISLPLEKRYVNFSVDSYNGQKWRLVIRVVIGLIIIVGLIIVLSLDFLLPSEIVWLRTLRYVILVIVGVVVWPWIFKRMNL